MAAYRKMTYEDACAVLEQGTYGVLATLDDDGTPYGVPLSYVAQGHHIYFHGAGKGHKATNMQRHPRVSFTVVEQADADPSHYTILYRSIIAFGEVHAVTDTEEKRAALERLCRKYGAPADPIHINTGLPRTAIWRMDVEYVSGKTNG